MPKFKHVATIVVVSWLTFAAIIYLRKTVPAAQSLTGGTLTGA